MKNRIYKEEKTGALRLLFFLSHKHQPERPHAAVAGHGGGCLLENYLIKVDILFRDLHNFVDLLHAAARVGDEEDAGVDLSAVSKQFFDILSDDPMHTAGFNSPQL